MKTDKHPVDGSNILYHYLQKNLYQDDLWFFQILVAKLVTSLAIWFRPSFYQRFPLLRPYAVRDATCRKRNNPQGIEQWGCPNEKGYFRDDNSLLKNIPSSLNITSPLKALYNGKTIGNGFVASHIWRGVNHDYTDDLYASRDPWTYSFIPNIVWLPAQVSKLTDREGSFSQLYLQAISVKIYRNKPVVTEIRPFVDEAWNRLPISETIPQQGLPEETELSFFDDTTSFSLRRISDIEVVSIALDKVIHGDPLLTKIISSRYGSGLKSLKPENVDFLADTLRKYLNAIRGTNEVL